MAEKNFAFQSVLNIVPARINGPRETRSIGKFTDGPGRSSNRIIRDEMNARDIGRAIDWHHISHKLHPGDRDSPAGLHYDRYRGKLVPSDTIHNAANYRDVSTPSRLLGR